MPDHDFPAADFYCQTGRACYRVRGSGSPNPLLPGKRAWLSFRLTMRPQPSPAGAAVAESLYWTTDTMFDYLPEAQVADDAALTLLNRQWYRALRQFATEECLELLARGKPLSEERVVQHADTDLLRQRLHRRCERQDTGQFGRLYCLVDVGVGCPTTQAICHDKCVFPDDWERCANLVPVRVQPVQTDQDGITDVAHQAQCNLGNTPEGGVLRRCRAGGGLNCFEPRIIGLAQQQSRPMGLRPTEP